MRILLRPLCLILGHDADYRTRGIVSCSRCGMHDIPYGGLVVGGLRGRLHRRSLDRHRKRVNHDGIPF